MGRGYVIEHFISSLNSNNEEKLYRIYVTDALKAICENTTHLVGREGVVNYGTTLTKRWIDLFDKKDEKPEQPEDNRPSEEIAADIWSRIRGK